MTKYIKDCKEFFSCMKKRFYAVSYWTVIVKQYAADDDKMLILFQKEEGGNLHI